MQLLVENLPSQNTKLTIAKKQTLFHLELFVLFPPEFRESSNHICFNLQWPRSNQVEPFIWIRLCFEKVKHHYYIRKDNETTLLATIVVRVTNTPENNQKLVEQD